MSSYFSQNSIKFSIPIRTIFGSTIGSNFYFDEKQIIFGHDDDYMSRSKLSNQMIVNLPEKSVVIEMKIGLTVNPSTFPLLKLPCHPFCPTFKSIWIKWLPPPQNTIDLISRKRKNIRKIVSPKIIWSTSKGHTLQLIK